MRKINKITYRFDLKGKNALPVRPAPTALTEQGQGTTHFEGPKEVATSVSVTTEISQPKSPEVRENSKH